MTKFVYDPTPVPSAPGVYVEITQPPPVQAPITAPVVGYVFEANRGLLDQAVDLGTFADFEAAFGLPSTDTNGVPLSGHLAARHLFEVGATQQYGVRVASALVKTGRASLVDASSNRVLDLQAASPGTWANELQYTVTPNTGNTAYTLTVVNNARPSEQDVIANIPVSDNAGAIAAINKAATLVVASQPCLAAPSAAPTVTASTGSGTVAAGTYYGVAAYTNGVDSSGNTKATGVSPETAAITLSAAGELTASVPSATGATGFDLYLGTAPGQETYAGSGVPGTPLVLSAPWQASTRRPPTMNTATTGAGSTTIPVSGTSQWPTTVSATGCPGADGAGSGAARHLGHDADKSGAYALFGFETDPEIVFFAGAAGTDTTQWAALAGLAQSQAAEAIVGFPAGTTSAAARTTVLGLSSLTSAAVAENIKATWPAVVVNDPDQGTWTVPSTAYYAGMTAVTARQTAVYNKPLAPVGPLGLSFVKPDVIASDSDLSTLDDDVAGVYVNALTAKIAKRGTGWYTDSMLAAPSVTETGTAANSFEVRVRSYVARQLYTAGGAYDGEAITDQLMAQAQLDVTALLDQDAAAGLIPQNDPGATTSGTQAVATTPTSATTAAKGTTAALTQAVSALTATLQATQQGSGSYVSYLCVCDRTVNTAASIAAGDLVIVVESAIAPNARRVIVKYTAGVGVTINTSSAGNTSASA